MTAGETAENVLITLHRRSTIPFGSQKSCHAEEWAMATLWES